MRFLVIVSILALVLLFGCTQTTPLQQSFSLDQPFQIKEGATYHNSIQDLSIKVISFTDSRCPQGVECIWAGERGVNLQVNDSNVYLGEVRSPGTTINLKGNAVRLSLLSINTAQAEIKVTFTPGNQVACTMEAKLCPDGVTYVGRSGPLCEFAPCPSCSCPTGYIQDGATCNPVCYYSTPKCLAPSIKCS